MNYYRTISSGRPEHYALDTFPRLHVDELDVQATGKNYKAHALWRAQCDAPIVVVTHRVTREGAPFTRYALAVRVDVNDGAGAVEARALDVLELLDTDELETSHAYPARVKEIRRLQGRKDSLLTALQARLQGKERLDEDTRNALLVLLERSA